MNKIKRVNNIVENLPEHRLIREGIFNIEGIECLSVGRYDTITDKQIDLFIKKYTDFCIADAYENDVMLLLSKRPTEIKPKIIGTNNFNYGVNAAIFDCPKNMLIIADND